MYTTTAPLLGLPTFRQAKKIRAKDILDDFYMPGINKWALQKLCQREVLKPLQNGMDETRIIRTLDLYRNKYIVGRQYPPDVRLFSQQVFEIPQSFGTSALNDYVMETRQSKGYAAEAYSINFSDTTGKFADLLIGFIPEATSGVTGDHILSLMLEIEKQASELNLPLIGHCTDSASNSLNGLVKLALKKHIMILT